MRAPRSAGCAGLGWGTWCEAVPRGDRAPRRSPPLAGHGGRGRQAGGGRAALGVDGRTGGSGRDSAGQRAPQRRSGSNGGRGARTAVPRRNGSRAPRGSPR